MYHFAATSKRAKQGTSGQSLVEYLAITTLIAIASLGSVKILGQKVKAHINRTTQSFDRTLKLSPTRSRTQSSLSTQSPLIQNSDSENDAD